MQEQMAILFFKSAWRERWGELAWLVKVANYRQLRLYMRSRKHKGRRRKRKEGSALLCVNLAVFCCKSGSIAIAATSFVIFSHGQQ